MTKEIKITGKDLRNKRTKDLLDLKLILNYIRKTKETPELTELIDRELLRQERRIHRSIQCSKTHK